MGLLPLLPGMSVRITQTLPDLKPFGLFKNTRGQLFGWALAPADVVAAPTCKSPEHVLTKLPLCLLVKVPDATWQHKPGLPPGVACLRPITQHWKLESQSNATIARRGFPLACDYAGTAHSFMGATLSACSLDLGFWDPRWPTVCIYVLVPRQACRRLLRCKTLFAPAAVPRCFVGPANPSVLAPEGSDTKCSQTCLRKRSPQPQAPCRDPPLLLRLQPPSEQARPTIVHTGIHRLPRLAPRCLE